MEIKIEWDFSPFTRDDLDFLGLKDIDVEEFNEEVNRLHFYQHNELAQHKGLPLYVDLEKDLGLEENCKDELITDALSDEFGFLVWSFYKL